ncbi:unnamed protein product [Mesocestoides corti]|uniref:Uncharacterized protein n=1 Tax=Mesocestoides corti TaxID=53468 RepID=A0A0R3UIV6_MESCO|nr:unnamed protein product [Mesocestoides corti]
MNKQKEEALLQEVTQLRATLDASRRDAVSGFNIMDAANSAEIGILSNIPSLTLAHNLRAHTGRIRACCWSPSDDNLISIGADNYICIWDVRSGLIRNIIDITMNQATAADTTRDLDVVFAGGLYANVEAFTHQARSPEDGYSEYVSSAVFEHGGRINCVTYLQGHKLLTAASMDGVVLWDINSVKVLRKFTHTTDVSSILPTSPDGQSFVTGAADGIPRVWDVRKPQPLVSAMYGHESEITCIERLSNERTFVTGSDDATVNLYDARLDFPLASYCRVDGRSIVGDDATEFTSTPANISGDDGGGDEQAGSDDSSTTGITGIGVSSSGRIVISGKMRAIIYFLLLLSASRQETPPWPPKIGIYEQKISHFDFSFPSLTFNQRYGGMLAAYMRLQYPHIISGAISSSAPFKWVTGEASLHTFFESIKEVYFSANETCIPIIQAAYVEILKRANEGQNGLKNITIELGLCQPLETLEDLDRMLRWSRNAFVVMSMMNYPYSSSFMSDLPANPVKVSCDRAIKFGIKNPLAGLREAVGVFYSKSPESCFDYKSQYIDCADITGCGLGDDSIAWDFQACTEMHLYDPSNATSNDLFPSLPKTLEEVNEYCYRKYGVRMSEKQLLTAFGPISIWKRASNIVFSNGNLDPWMKGGILEDVSKSVTALQIHGGAHHLDLRSANEADPPSVKIARQTEIEAISEWLKEYEDYCCQA